MGQEDPLRAMTDIQGAMSSKGAITYTRYCKVYDEGQKSKVL